MHELLDARLFGLSITAATVFVVLGRELRNAEWRARFRNVMEERTSKRHRRSLWSRYVDRVLAHYQILDKPYTERTTLTYIAVLFFACFAVTWLLHYFVLFGIVTSLGVSMLLYERYFARLARRRREEILNAFLRQGVERGVHVLSATGQLDEAFRRMTDTIRFAPLRRRLLALCRLMASPQFATPEDAFVHWANGLGIEDMAHFALATREAKKYNVPLDQLWLDMAEIQGKELEYVRRIRAETAHQRTGGYWFYGMLTGSFLVAYPFVSSYMSEVTRFFFWITLAVMTLGLYLIIRRSQVIEV
jgi:Flp pilus assembly protein TadB